ncbi:MAG TPA: TrmH family RNA methyltransferase [Cellvibrionaceae bacterium]|nr:TrmH family RNA methyltransferase [Cellvibrionaceae bacterium]HNG59759.1 TrmH family RNA methyltransferase [Cellvibrionaceae bacterium]
MVNKLDGESNALRSVLLLFNIQKAGNFGKLIRTANALGVAQVCIVGRRDFATHGHHHTKIATEFSHFYKPKDALEHYRKQGFDLVAVEIGAQAVNINRHQFVRDTVFVMGNETTGVSPELLALCNYAVYIPQYGAGASLNVNVAAGIVLNAFNAQRPSHNPIAGAKFCPDELC